MYNWFWKYFNECWIGTKKSNFNIIKICSRNELTGEKLAKKLNSNFSKEIFIPKKTDLVILGVPDDQIKKISKKIKCKAIIHTAGTRNIDILKTVLKIMVLYGQFKHLQKQKLILKTYLYALKVIAKNLKVY